jgi:UDP-3-O-[3-hydroxymyristoyl] glucosamine N-acyltransferase
MLITACWWLGWTYFAAWLALPLVLLPLVGAPAGVVLWAVAAPWSALLGMAAAHRLLPASRSGTFKPGRDGGALRWGFKQWAPSLYLTVFQPVFFQSEWFARVALRAFGATLGPGAVVTSRAVVREPHLVRLGAGSLVGEYAHLIGSYQPRRGVLIVGRIHIGNDVLIGAYSRIAPGARIGSGSLIEHGVAIGPQTTIGERARIGAGSAIYSAARVGADVTIGKHCVVPSGSVIPDGAIIPDGTIVARAAPAAQPGSAA